MNQQGTVHHRDTETQRERRKAIVFDSSAPSASLCLCGKPPCSPHTYGETVVTSCVSLFVMVTNAQIVNSTTGEVRGWPVRMRIV
jgi:hypothetical protein